MSYTFQKTLALGSGMMSGFLDEWLQRNSSTNVPRTAEFQLCEALIKQALDELPNRRYFSITLHWILDDVWDFDEAGVIPFNIACALVGIDPGALRSRVMKTITLWTNGVVRARRRGKRKGARGSQQDRHY